MRYMLTCHTMIKPNENQLVKKANRLIEASSRLDLQEQRLIAAMSAQITDADEDFKYYTFTAKDLAELCNITSTSYYSEVRKTVSNIMKKTLRLRTSNEEIVELHWISVAKYNSKTGTIGLKFEPTLKPYLLQLHECYTRYTLGDVFKFKSKYSFRLYELLRQYQDIGSRVFEVEDLREKLGVDQLELKLFADFKRRAIEPALKEINAKSSLSVTCEYKKTGRAYTHLKFTMKEKPVAKPQTEKPLVALGLENLLDLIPDSLRGLKATKNRLIKALQRHDVTYIRQQIEYTNKHNTKKESYLNYLGKAIDNNYAELETEMADEKKKISEAEREKKLAEYRLMSDKDIKDLADRGNDYAKTVLYERAQTTITWTEAPVEPAQAPVESADSIWTDDQLAEMAAGGNARAQAILTERIRAQIPK